MKSKIDVKVQEYSIGRYCDLCLKKNKKSILINLSNSICSHYHIVLCEECTLKLKDKISSLHLASFSS